MIKDISGVILAGGENIRFGGKSKTGIVIGGRTIFSRMTNTLKEIFEEIIIVTNDPAKFSGTDQFKITGDIFIKKGPAGGLHAALKASSNAAVFVFAGDMPFLSKQLIKSQIELFSASKCDALVPLIKDHIEPLHSIYRTSLIDKLETYLSDNVDTSMHGFISQIKVDFMVTEASEKAVRSFTNINTTSDLADIIKMSTSSAK